MWRGWTLNMRLMTLFLFWRKQTDCPLYKLQTNCLFLKSILQYSSVTRLHPLKNLTTEWQFSIIKQNFRSGTQITEISWNHCVQLWWLHHISVQKSTSLIFKFYLGLTWSKQAPDRSGCFVTSLFSGKIDSLGLSQSSRVEILQTDDTTYR